MARTVEFARRAGANLARVARRVMARSVLPPGSGRWLLVRLTPGLDELAAPRLPWTREEPLSLLDVLATLEAAARDAQIDGVLLRLSGSPSGWSKVLSLRRALERVREAGKPVAAYADELDAEGLLLASAADRIWLPETGNVMLVGLRMEALYLRGLLERLHLRPDVIHIGTHKTSAERYTRDSMSPEERQQLEALADDLFAELVDGLAAGRGLDAAGVRDRIDGGPYTARAAAEAGLIDGCLYPDELEHALEALAPPPPPERPGPRRAQLVEAPVYHALRASDIGWRPLFHGLPRVAYVVARGAIHRGGGMRGIGSDSLRPLLERIRGDESVRGLVLRIDSPGGDGLASDLLWRTLCLVKREKPVVVSMGDMATSGGYYLAAAGDAVLAEASTITGSIGVVGGKLDLGALFERVGVGAEAIERGARSGLLSSARGFTPAERKALREEMAALYAAFVERVAEGRGMSIEAVDRVAQGQVWSGAAARRLGLVDALGGPLEALDEVRRRAGLAPDERAHLDVHPRLPTFPGLRALLHFLPGQGRG